MAIGNHEFDLQPSTLEAALSSSFQPDSGFPLLSANLILEDPSLEGLKDYISPFIIKQAGNLKVGIFGMTTPETNILSQPGPAVIDTNLFQITSSMVDTLIAENCDVIICLSHLGFYLDQLLASNIPGIHVIVGAHDHYIFEESAVITNPEGKDTYIVQANAFYKHIGKLQIIVENGDVDLLGYQLIHLDQTTPEEPTIAAEVDALIAGIEATYGPVYTQQIGESTEYFEEVADSLLFEGYHDTPVGNLVSDAYRLTMGTDIAIEPGGSTAQPFYEGPLVAADAFKVVGYGFNTHNGLGFRLATFDILGANLWAGLEVGLSQIELNDEFLLQVSGMKYVYDPQMEPFSRLISVEVGSQQLDLSAIYSVTANEFVLLFMNTIDISISNVAIYNDSTEFQVLANYIASQGTIYPLVDGRIEAKSIGTDVDSDSDLIPDAFVLEQNYPNPFNPITTIKFSLPNSTYTKLKVYNTLGQEVETLVNENLAGGGYKVEWNAKEFASGVYLYRLESGSFIKTKKLILIK